MTQGSGSRPGDAPGRRRVLVIGPSTIEIGGAGARTQVLIDEFVRQGWEVRMVSRGGTLRYPRVARRNHLLGLHIPGFSRRRLGSFLFVLVGLILGIYWGRHSSFILTIQLSSPTLLGSLCGRLLGLPVVALSSSSGTLSEVPNLTLTLPRLKSWILGGVSIWVGQTTQHAEELQRVAPPDRVKVIPNPVVIPNAPPPLNGSPRVLYAGRFSEEKNLLMLVAAWEKLPKELGAVLLLVGEGGRYRSIEAQLYGRVESSSKAADIQILPWTLELSRVMSTADVFVLPSTSEGMSNVLLEAAGLGRVIVASRIEANIEVLGVDYPLLFTPTCESELVQVLTLALTDVSLREMARRIVLERITNHSPPFIIQELIAAANV